MKKLVFLVLAFVVVGSLGVAACAGGETTVTKTVTQTVAGPGATATVTETATATVTKTTATTLTKTVATTAAPKVYKWRYQSLFPEAMSYGDQEFADDVASMSNGRIQLEVYTAGQLIPTDEILNAVKTGTIEIGHSFGAYYSEIDVGVIESALPMAWASASEAEVAWERLGLKDVVAEAYEEQGVHYLGPLWGAPYALLTKEPVSSLDDLKKLKIRCTTGPAKMLNKLGVSTVYLPSEEIYLALNTGQIDGVIYGAGIEYVSMGWHEVAPYLNTSFILDPLVENMFINLKIWNELPDDLKAVLEAAVYRARWRHYAWVLQDDYGARAKEFKGKLTAFPPEDVAKLTEAALAVWDEQAAQSPRSEKAIQIVKELNRLAGRLK